MSSDGLVAALVLLSLGVALVVFRRPIGGLLRFSLLSPPDLRGWGYWEKLVPSEAVAWSLGELTVFSIGCLLTAIGVVGLVLTFLGFK
ncbi:MAG: hypothetical protein ACYCXR_09505 [Coriobacteriia bacterium]